MNYLNKSKKAKAVVKIINEAIKILVSVGIPTDDKTQRNLERMAMTFWQ